MKALKIIVIVLVMFFSSIASAEDSCYNMAAEVCGTCPSDSLECKTALSFAEVTMTYKDNPKSAKLVTQLVGMCSEMENQFLMAKLEHGNHGACLVLRIAILKAKSE